MITIQPTIKSIFSMPIPGTAFQPARNAFSDTKPFQAVDTFNGKVQFGCSQSVKPDTHALGRLDTFI